MASEEQTFYDQPVDRTPYAAFTWVIGGVIILTGLLIAGAWKVGSAYKGSDWFSSLNQPGASDALIEQGKATTDNVLDQAQNAASRAAADAQQKLNEQRDAAIRTAADAAQEEAKKQAQNQIDQFLK